MAARNKAQGILCAVAFTFFFAACSDSMPLVSNLPNQSNSSSSEPPVSTPAPTPLPSPTAVPSPSPTPTPQDSVEVAPLWEAKRPVDGKLWTAHAVSVVEKDGAALLSGTSDIASFCPSYAQATYAERVNFWVYLVSAVVKYESGFDPADRYAETALGIDAVTKLPVFSEGLLQLSYQDVLSYPFCNEFDWSQDQYLAATDPAKTIFDPYKNLTCGIRILNEQVRRKGLLAVRGYWSTLFPAQQNSHSKVPQIQAMTTQLAFCR